jgi:uncharacterized membrane protein
MHQIFRNIVGLLLGLAFAAIGYQHFASPEFFNAIVPAYLGIPWFWTYASGVLEIAFGIGMAIPAIRPVAGRLMTALVLLMSLANLNMWINDIPLNGRHFSSTWHLMRMLIQIVLLLVLLWLGEVIPRRVPNDDTAG